MRALRWTAAAVAALGLPVGAAGCSPKKVGQIVLVLNTDLSLPKDIDAIRIEVLNEGTPKFKNDYERLGSAKGGFKIPGTLTLVASDKPSDAITITVSARSGGMGGDLRIVREIVTTIPQTRVAMLDIPIQFLCDGSGKLVDGDAASNCPIAGETCIAGTCTSNKVDSSTLPDYSPTQVLGDGSCLDVTSCFNDGAVAMLDIASCTLPGATGINVALQVEGDGICGPVGCFVPLDEGSDVGWKVAKDGTITLPPAVCGQIKSGKIVNVVTAPVTADCKLKNEALPTCGSWSSATNNPPPYVGPIALAGGQARSVALALGNGDIFWTTTGTKAGAEGAVKGVAPVGGTPVIAGNMESPRDLVATDKFTLWTSAPGTGTGTGSLVKWAPGDTMPVPLLSSLDAPEGLAIRSGRVFWTDYQSGNIYQASIDSAGSMITGQKVIAQGNYPSRIVADDTFVYWTNEGMLMSDPPDGSVSRYAWATQAPMSVDLATQQSIPRAIALDFGKGQKLASAVYWTTFSDTDGAIFRVDLSGSMPGTPEKFASGLKTPNGIAVDADPTGNVYWTTRTDGKVMWLRRTDPPGTKPNELATLQNAPGAIAVDATNVYWVNEGASDSPSGAVIKLPKPAGGP